MIVRVAIVAVALAAAGWFATSLQSERLHSQATDKLGSSSGSGFALLMRSATPGNLRESADLLERSRKWAPLQAPVILEAELMTFSGRRQRGVDLLEQLLDREPENADAWAALATILAPTEPARAAAARRRFRELSPPVARR